MRRRVGVFDLETTGVDVETDHIVTAFFGVLNDAGEVVEAHDFMVKPEGYVIPDEAAAIHGVTTEEALAKGRPLVEVLEEIAALIREHCKDGRLPLVGHNLSYDLTLFDREAQRTFPTRPGRSVARLLENVYVLDSYVLDKAADRYRKGKRTLIATAEVYGVTLSEDEAHGARADAIASGRIVQQLLYTKPEVGGLTLFALQGAQKRWKAEQAASLQKHLRTREDDPIPNAIVDPNWPFTPRAVTEGQYG